MSEVVTFTDYRPSPRFPPVVTPWTHARVEQMPIGGAWSTVETFVLDPPDPDPKHPGARSFTTELGTVTVGFYRVVFIDADGNEQLTDALVYPPVSALPVWAPTVEDIAGVCPAYTRGPIDEDAENAGAERPTFDDTTDPTAAEVRAHIGAACLEVKGRVGAPIPISCYDLATTTAKWHAAASIEAEKSPVAAEADGPARWKWASYVACLKDLQARIPSALRLA